MTNVGGRRVSRFGPTLTDDERDSHPLIPPRFMHLRSLDSKILVYSRSAPLAVANGVLYIYGGFIMHVPLS